MKVITEEYMELHHDMIIIDGTCPLGREEEHIHRWAKGGVTVMTPTVASNENCLETIYRLGTWEKIFKKNQDKLLHIQCIDDIYEAKKSNKLGVMFHFQNSLPIERNINLLSIYHKLGVRIIQLCYNQKNFVGDGCHERTNSGLSEFGVQVIKEMNRLGIVVDLSHTGYHTTLDAIEVSEEPVIFSHSNVYNLCQNNRNVTDEQIIAVAKKKGVIGIQGFAFLTKEDRQPTLDDYVNHIDYIANLVGVEHVGVSLDFYQGMSTVMSDEDAINLFNRQVSDGRWKKETYPHPPWKYPKGLETPERFPNLTKKLLERGYSPHQVRLIMGENFIRVFNDVWTNS